jgi:tRNA (guanine-N7-)-methyltransferase
MIDPNDFIITRKRKKYKFAKFANSSLCFEFDSWNKQSSDVIEVGAGTGLFTVELAQRNPSQQFVAVDVKADRLQKGAYEAEERGLKNIYFLRARADQLLECFETSSVGAIWVTFPDPFPKQRSAGRRMTHPRYLNQYAQLLNATGSLMVKHDSTDFFHWSLEQLVRERWSLNQLSFDLHESDVSDEYKIETTYEQRWRSEGLEIGFVQAMPLRYSTPSRH